MIWTALAAAGNVARKIPAWVYIAAISLVAIWVWGNSRYAAGVEDERERWEEKVEAAQDSAREADVGAANQRAVDTERTNADDTARREAARTGGRDAVNCARLQRAYPDRSFPACD